MKTFAAITLLLYWSVIILAPVIAKERLINSQKTIYPEKKPNKYICHRLYKKQKLLKKSSLLRKANSPMKRALELLGIFLLEPLKAFSAHALWTFDLKF